MKSFIHIVEGPAKPKTLTWTVEAQSDEAPIIADIAWYSPRRQYCFFPRPATVFEEASLREIADFCELQTKLHKAKKK